MFGAKSSTIEALHVLARECGHPDWDGHGEEPLAPAAVIKAEALIRALPSDVPLPEVSPDPDGSILLGWIDSRYRRITVNIDSGNLIAFAWMDGNETGREIELFDGSVVPGGLLQAIERIIGHGAAPLRVA